MKIGEILAHTREQQGLSQKELAQLLSAAGDRHQPGYQQMGKRQHTAQCLSVSRSLPYFKNH